MKVKNRSNEEALIEENLGLIQYVIRTKFNSSQDTNSYDELYSCGLVGLWKAASTYDPSKSKFSTYAHLIIYREMLCWTKSKSNHVSFYSQNDCGGKSKHSISDVLPPLSEQESTILQMRLDGYTLKEIGKRLGFSTTTAFNKFEEIKNKIRIANDAK